MEAKLVIGISAGVLTAVSSLPQIFKVLRDKKAQAVSPVMYFVLLGGMHYGYGTGFCSMRSQSI